MKVTSVSVRLADDGQFHVNLGMSFTSSEEAFEEYQDESGILGLIAASIETFKEQSEFKPVSRDTSAGGKPANPTEAPETGSGRRTRRGASAEDASAATNMTAGSTTTEATEPPTQRRRRGSSEPQSPQSPAQEQPSSGQAETSGRRRRGTSAAAESAPIETAPATASLTTISPSEEAAPLSRRRRGSATTEPSSPTGAATAQATVTNSAAASGSLTDADVSKAASEAARLVGPKPVLEIVAEFTGKDGKPIAGTHELLPEDRQEFVNALKELTK